MDGTHGLPISLSEVHTQTQERKVQREMELGKERRVTLLNMTLEELGLLSTAKETKDYSSCLFLLYI